MSVMTPFEKVICRYVSIFTKVFLRHIRIVSGHTTAGFIPKWTDNSPHRIMVRLGGRQMCCEPIKSLPTDSARIRRVASFEELASTPFGDGINALCWRSLPGNFDHDQLRNFSSHHAVKFIPTAAAIWIVQIKVRNSCVCALKDWINYRSN